MKKFLILFAICFAVNAVVWMIFRPTPLTPQEVSKLNASKTTNQLILVGGIGGSNAVFTLYVKQNGQWREVLTTPAYIGKNGLGKTKEGDGKTPIGQFHFTKAFGIASDPGSIMDYTKVDDSHYWNGDSRSSRYNQFVSIRDYDFFDKKESEHIIEYVKPYQYCLNISYNEDGTPQLGSAIFLHCYSNNTYTGGCVAIPEDLMKKVLTIVHPQCQIVIDYLVNLASY